MYCVASAWMSIMADGSHISKKPPPIETGHTGKSRRRRLFILFKMENDVILFCWKFFFFFAVRTQYNIESE
jgi:hypothetical protein